MKIKRDYLLEDRDVSVGNLRTSIQTHGGVWTGQMLLKSFAEGLLSPARVPFHVVAEACGVAGLLREREIPVGGGYIGHPSLTQEDAVGVAAFANITGQIVYTMVKDAYMESDQRTWDELVNVIETPFNGEKIPRMGEILDEEFLVKDGMPYPQSGFGEHWINTPATDTYGMIVSVTRQAVFFDRTGGQVRQKAQTVGRRLATGRLKRMLDLIAGVTNSYQEDGTSYNTYQTAGTLWTNGASKTLTDYTDIDEAIQLASLVTDPDTGNPIDLSMGTLLTVPALRMTSRRIMNATGIEQGAISATVPRTASPNPIAGEVDGLVVSPLLRARLVASGVSTTNADVYWYFGDFKRAFAYMQNWPLTVVEAPPQNPDEFHRDVVAAYKASERGVPAVMEPRYVQRFTN